MKKIIAIAFMLTLVITALCGCSIASPSFEALVKDGKYMEAARCYSEDIIGNGTREYECREFLSQYLREAIDAYAAGQLSESEAYGAFTTVEYLHDSFYLVDNFFYMEDEFNRLRLSKESWKQGTALENQGDYLGAREAFMSVAEADWENYSAALEKISSLGNSICAQYRDSIRAAKEQGAYIEAIDLYMEFDSLYMVPGDFEIIDMAEECIGLYIEKVREETMAAFGANKDINAAGAVIQQALAESSHIEDIRIELEALNAEITSYAPVALSSLDPVRRGEYVRVGAKAESDYTDVEGNSYNKDNVIRPVGGDLNSNYAKTLDAASLSYVLNYEYSSFSGVIYRPYSYLSCTGSFDSVPSIVQIYGDGILLGEFADPGTPYFSPVSFEIDVSGVRELTLIVAGTWKESVSYGVLDRHPTMCMAELMLQK